MRVRGVDVWPAALTTDLVEEMRGGRRLRNFPPGRPRTLVDVLDRAVARSPDREAVVDAERRLTWRELADEARRMAATLHRRHGIGRGDRVALLMLNGVPFCVSVFACTVLGAVAVPLNTKLRSGELAYMLENSGARVLLMDARLWPEIASIRATVPLEAILVLGDAPPGTEPFERLADTRDASLPRPPVEDDLALIMYTSGTTGRPKGAVSAHRTLVTSLLTFERCCELGADERTLIAVPVFHATGLIAQLLVMACVGGTAVLLRTFDAAEALRLLDAERITHIHAAPTVYVMLMSQPGYRERGRTMRVFAYGGAPMPPPEIQRLRAWRPEARLYNIYGMTETVASTAYLRDADALRKSSTVGWPVPVVDVRTVRPENGEECGPDEVGELWVWGPTVVSGYWANPDATAATMGDGWLRTGDLARIDAEGFVSIVDRLKDMINRGGEKVYCVEVEDVLCGHPAVQEAAVVGIPDPVYGEAVRACVVPRAGHAIDADDIRRWVGERLAKFKVPREVVVLDALPRNPNGKVVKRALR